MYGNPPSSPAPPPADDSDTTEQLAAAVAQQIPAASDVKVTAVDRRRLGSSTGSAFSVEFTLFGEVNSSVGSFTDRGGRA